MAKVKRRNHYIPRFLLKRFATAKWPSEAKRKGHMIWQYDRNTAPRRISIRDAAVRKNFYGKQDDALEEAFSKVEHEFDKIISGIEAGQKPQEMASELRFMVWCLFVRTLALRTKFADATSGLINQFNRPDVSEALYTDLIANADEHIGRELDEHLRDLTPSQRQLAMLYLEKSGAMGAIKEQLGSPSFKRQFHEFMGSFVEQAAASNLMERAAEKGHIKSLQRLVDDRHVPANFDPASWHLVKSPTPEDCVVLCDTCVFGISQDARPRSLATFGGDWSTIYMPLSKELLLIGSRELDTPFDNVSEINRMSVRVSHASFFSSHKQDHLIALSAEIGADSEIVSEEELTEIVDGAILDIGGATE